MARIRIEIETMPERFLIWGVGISQINCHVIFWRLKKGSKYHRLSWRIDAGIKLLWFNYLYKCRDAKKRNSKQPIIELPIQRYTYKKHRCPFKDMLIFWIIRYQTVLKIWLKRNQMLKSYTVFWSNLQSKEFKSYLRDLKIKAITNNPKIRFKLRYVFEVVLYTAMYFVNIYFLVPSAGKRLKKILFRDEFLYFANILSFFNFANEFIKRICLYFKTNQNIISKWFNKVPNYCWRSHR